MAVSLYYVIDFNIFRSNKFIITVSENAAYRDNKQNKISPRISFEGITNQDYQIIVLPS